jgi:hypothetical protein
MVRHTRRRYVRTAPVDRFTRIGSRPPGVDELIAAAPVDAKLAFLLAFASPTDLLSEAREHIAVSVSHDGVQRSLLAKMDSAAEYIAVKDYASTCDPLTSLLAESQAQRKRFSSAEDRQRVVRLLQTVQKMVGCYGASLNRAAWIPSV